MNDGLAHRFPQRALRWQLRDVVWTFDRSPRLMGILNVTPDSFSDGGHFLDRERAIAQGMTLIEQGADMLDVGGESTRPYAEPVEAAEELRRVIPVIEGLARRTRVPISIDTSKACVAEAALDAGAHVINDVTGLTGDRCMIDVARRYGAGVCAMHMQGTPQTMQDAPHYTDVVAEISDYLRARRDALLEQGLDRARICLDPGIGFGKTHTHNATLMARCGEFHALQSPLLVGHSRKGFLGKWLRDKDDLAARAAASAGAAAALARQGIHVLRVHDVALVRDVLAAFVGSGGVDGIASQWA